MHNVRFSIGWQDFRYKAYQYKLDNNIHSPTNRELGFVGYWSGAHSKGNYKETKIPSIFEQLWEAIIYSDSGRYISPGTTKFNIYTNDNDPRCNTCKNCLKGEV